jgi:hypothetical protein
LFGVRLFVFGLGAWGSAEGLVVAVGVEGEFAQKCAGGCVDDADVGSVEEFEDGGSGVFGADADVVGVAVVAQAEFAVVVDDVV